MPLAWLLPTFSHFPCYPQANFTFLVLIPRWGGGVRSRIPWIFPVNSPVRLGVSPPLAQPPQFLPPEVLWRLFPALEPWVGPSVWLPSCSSQFIGTYMWDRLVQQPPPCHASSPPQMSLSAPPLSLDEYFFFNSLVVGLPYSSIFWQLWLVFLFLNWLLSSFGCSRKQSVSTYTSILAGNLLVFHLIGPEVITEFLGAPQNCVQTKLCACQ